MYPGARWPTTPRSSSRSSERRLEQRRRPQLPVALAQHRDDEAALQGANGRGGIGKSLGKLPLRRRQPARLDALAVAQTRELLAGHLAGAAPGKKLVAAQRQAINSSSASSAFRGVSVSDLAVLVT